MHQIVENAFIQWRLMAQEGDAAIRLGSIMPQWVVC